MIEHSSWRRRPTPSRSVARIAGEAADQRASLMAARSGVASA